MERSSTTAKAKFHESKDSMGRKFHGLSTPEELISMWDELKLDEDKRKLNVIWDYTSPKQLKPGFNIVNILYNPQYPEETGHYVLITVNPNINEVEYFNPVSNHTEDNLDKLEAIMKYFYKKKYEVNVDLSGKQTETSDNCGFHCLTHAYNYYNNPKNRMWPKAKVEQNYEPDTYAKERIAELKEVQQLFRKKGGDSLGGATTNNDMDELLKVVRGIYYGLKFGFDSRPQRKGKKRTSDEGKKKAAAGLSDYGKQEYNYTELRHEIED